MSAPVKVAVKNSASSIEPIAAFAPSASISFCFSFLLLITVTECPFAIRPAASGLLICPKDPVSTIFIILFSLNANLHRSQKAEVSKSSFVVANNQYCFSSGEISHGLLRSVGPAGRRYNATHPQINNHLSIMFIGVDHCRESEIYPGQFISAEWYHIHGIICR